MANNIDQNLDEFSAEEQELIRRVELATRHELPAGLATRLEAEIASGPQLKPRPLALVQWGTLAASLVLVITALVLGYVFLNNSRPVTAAEVEKRVGEAAQKNITPGSIRHRLYDMTDAAEGVGQDGKPVKISIPLNYEDWSLIREGGFISKIKSVESGSVDGNSYRQTFLYTEDEKLNRIYSDPPGKIIEIPSGDFKYSVNELETKEQFLKNPNQQIYSGSLKYTQVSLLEPNKDSYVLRYEFEAEQLLEGKQVKSKGQMEFTVSKKSYEVTGYKYSLFFKDPRGNDVSYVRDAKITSTELLAPDPTRTNEIFQLGAPPNTPVEKQ